MTRGRKTTAPVASGLISLSACGAPPTLEQMGHRANKAETTPEYYRTNHFLALKTIVYGQPLECEPRALRSTTAEKLEIHHGCWNTNQLQPSLSVQYRTASQEEDVHLSGRRRNAHLRFSCEVPKRIKRSVIVALCFLGLCMPAEAQLLTTNGGVLYGIGLTCHFIEGPRAGHEEHFDSAKGVVVTGLLKGRPCSDGKQSSGLIDMTNRDPTFTPGPLTITTSEVQLKYVSSNGNITAVKVYSLDNGKETIEGIFLGKPKSR